jgi:hypothetical protein
MKLKEKFTNSIVLAFEYEEKIQKSLVIADDYAIEFAHWCEWQDGKAFKTFEELLEIFKKEKGL